MDGATPTMPTAIFGGLVGATLKRISALAGRRQQKTMRLCETLALGDRRFLAVVTVDDQRFLVGGAAGSIALLAQLPSGKQQGEASGIINHGTLGI